MDDKELSVIATVSYDYAEQNLKDKINAIPLVRDFQHDILEEEEEPREGYKSDPYYIALYKWVTTNQIMNGGQWHQEEGVPVYSDGNYTAVSWRSWGSILATIWNQYLGEEKYVYMDFYMEPLAI